MSNNEVLQEIWILYDLIIHKIYNNDLLLLVLSLIISTLFTTY